MKDEKILQINKRSFLLVCGVLICVMLASYGLTFLLPQGQFVEGTFIQAEARTPLSFLGFLIAPLETLWHPDTSLTVLIVSLFILIIGGVFNLIDRTGGIKSMIFLLIEKNQAHKRRLMYIIILGFMLFGALFGIFEESVTLLPMVVLLAISLGWDTFTGLGMCLMAAGFGFSSALTNPFSIGLSISTVNRLLGTDLTLTDGLWFRVLIFLLMYGILCGYLTLHVRRIEKDPTRSPTYEADLEKRNRLDLSSFTPDKRAAKVYTVMFLTIVVITLVIATVPATNGYTVPAIALSFLVGGIFCAKLLHCPFKEIGKHFLSGLSGMLPAVIMILLASSIKLILEKGQIMDTVIHYMTDALSGAGPLWAILTIYLAILVIQFFIGSSSAKVMVVIPIIALLVDRLGFFSQNLALLAYLFGDGYTDLLYPTNPILLISLGMVSFSYVKWLKKTLPLQLLILALTGLILLLGYLIGY